MINRTSVSAAIAAAASLFFSNAAFPLISGSSIVSLDASAVANDAPISSVPYVGQPLQSGAGLSIVLNKGATLLGNAAASSAFDRAAQYYMDRFADPVTINLSVDLINLGAGILGQAGSTMYTAGYTTLRDAMVSDQQTSVGAGDITDSLPTFGQATFQVPTGSTVAGMSITAANAKALGFTVNPLSDATIQFNQNFAFDFNNTNGIGAGLYDFEGIAIHEIGHALGFVSEVDTADYLVANSLTGSLYATPLDLFRLTPGAGATNFTTATRLLVPGSLQAQQVSYFGAGQQYNMSTGSSSGDGRQASHWKDSLGIGILDPTAASGELLNFTVADLRAFDVIGWDIAAVPVPAAAWLFASGLGVIGILRRGQEAA